MRLSLVDNGRGCSTTEQDEARTERETEWKEVYRSMALE
jgi:hypothetical protein